jgi:hypothetical protein
MPRFRYDKDMDCIIEIRDGGNYPEPEKRARPRGVISDLDPYRAVASDVACGGKRPVITGRRQHREFLQRNGYVEVGNERGPAPSDAPSPQQARGDRVNDIRRALGDFGSNTGSRH